MKKRILVSIPTARMIRFFLDTDVFEELTKQDIEIVVVHNQSSIQNLISKYSNITAINYPEQNQITKFKKFLRSSVNIPSVTKRFFSTGYIGFKNIFLNENGFLNKLKGWIKIILSLILFNIPVLGKRVYQNAFHDESFNKFIVENRIDGVILTCPVLNEERILACESNKLNIPVCIGTDGWDLFINFGYVHKYNGVMVWGNEMANHAKVLGFNESQIIFTGIPYKKKFENIYNNIDKQAVRDKYGIKEDEKIILLFGGSWYATGDIEKTNVHNLLKAIDDEVLTNTKIIFRMFPRNVMGKEEEYYLDTYKNNKNIIFQKPNVGFVETTSENVTENAFKEVVEIFSISDVVINILSMCFLEASIFNVPSIICNYEDVYYPTKYVTNSILYKNLIRDGLIEVKKSSKLVNKVEAILKSDVEFDSNNILENWNKRDAMLGEKIITILFGVNSSDN